MREQKPLMTALFPDRESAELGYSTLPERGYSRDDISVVMSEDTRQRYFRSALDTDLGKKAANATGACATVGGFVSALLGWNIPEERLRFYDQGIRNGGILMVVQPRNKQDAAHFENSWRINRAQAVYG